MSMNRFWSKVDKSGGPDACWPWTAYRLKGYGQVWAGGKMVLAHRLAYELVNGPIPDNLCALHRCDNPPCCNPAHIFLGTQADNMADKTAKGRQSRGEQHYSRTKPERMVRGERNGRAKLNEAQVQEIRAAYAAGGVTLHELAARFVVGQATVWRVVRRKTWNPACPASAAANGVAPAN